MNKEQELIIFQLLLDAAKKDFEEVLANDHDTQGFSPKYLLWEDRFLQHPAEMGRRKFRPLRQRFLRSVACIVLILFVFCGSALIVSPVVRAAVTEWLQLAEQPTMTEIDVSIHLSGFSGSVYTSERFACVEENGDCLRYRFHNKGNDPCTMQLYKVHFPKDQIAGEVITVEPGKDRCGRFDKPKNGIFYLRVTCTSGIGSELVGILQAEQINMSER